MEGQHIRLMLGHLRSAPNFEQNYYHSRYYKGVYTGPWLKPAVSTSTWVLVQGTFSYVVLLGFISATLLPFCSISVLLERRWRPRTKKRMYTLAISLSATTITMDGAKTRETWHVWARSRSSSATSAGSAASDLLLVPWAPDMSLVSCEYEL